FGKARPYVLSSKQSPPRPQAGRGPSRLRTGSKVPARPLKPEGATKQEPEVRTATGVLLPSTSSIASLSETLRSIRDSFRISARLSLFTPFNDLAHLSSLISGEE